MDFDSTVMNRSGEREGAARGCNPRRPGRRSVHPPPAFVADIRMIAGCRLRPGNTGTATGFLSFPENTLGRLRNGKVGLIRADSGFYSKEIFDCPEGNTLPHIIACRFTGCFKYAPVHQQAWTEMAD
ncbi:MAG: IS1380 family transposase, partial [Dysgonamonadaceae bacterium]|nr:IS1380 family transposase [Dysgonamonadaceae bacterium]